MAENNKNSFDTTVASLFKGMDSFISAKTVVGEAVHVKDTIILPLCDVSFGVGAGAFAGDKKNNAGGVMTARMVRQSLLISKIRIQLLRYWIWFLMLLIK